MTGAEEVVAPGAVAARGVQGRATSALAAASEHLVWVLLVLLMGVGLFVRGFWGVANLTNVLWAAAPTGLMVLGLFFVMLTGGLDLSLESTYGFAPAIGILFMVQWLPAVTSPLIAIVITVLVGAAVGLFNGVASVLMRVNAFLITLATLLILRGLSIYLVPEGIYNLPEGYTYLGGAQVAGIPVAIFVAAAAFVVAYMVMNRHSFGKAL